MIQSSYQYTLTHIAEMQRLNSGGFHMTIMSIMCEVRN